MPQRSNDTAIRFTLLCLRARFDPDALEAARALTAGLDWDAWVDTGRVEALTPLLYRILHGRDIVPAAVEARLQADYFHSVRSNAFRFRELGRALRELAAERVPVILLKGAALAETVYGNIATRPMTDLDLLVRRGDLAPALAALAKLGYQLVGTDTHTGAASVFENEVMLRKPGALYALIEIHWSLLNSPHYQHLLPMAWFWETAVPVRVEGAEALVLAPEALLLHLCAHRALHHRGMGLLWLHDVAEVLHFFQDRVDWDLLLAKAAECDLVLPLQKVLSQVVEGWLPPVPAGSLERLRRLEPTPEEIRVFNWLTAERRPVAQRFWADLVSMPDWGQRLRYGMGNLFPSAAYMRQRYGIRHGFLLPLYYPWRWLIGLRGAVQLLGKREIKA
jgi:hypothetical protein